MKLNKSADTVRMANKLISNKVGNNGFEVKGIDIYLRVKSIIEENKSYGSICDICFIQLRKYIRWVGKELTSYTTTNFSKESVLEGKDLIRSIMLMAMSNIAGVKGVTNDDEYNMLYEDFLDKVDTNLLGIQKLVDFDRSNIVTFDEDDTDLLGKKDFFYSLKYDLKIFLTYCSVCVINGENGKMTFAKADWHYVSAITYLKRSRYLLSKIGNCYDDRKLCAEASVRLSDCIGILLVGKIKKIKKLNGDKLNNLQAVIKYIKDNDIQVDEYLLENASAVIITEKSVRDLSVKTYVERTLDCIVLVKEACDYYLNTL